MKFCYINKPGKREILEGLRNYITKIRGKIAALLFLGKLY